MQIAANQAEAGQHRPDSRPLCKPEIEPAAVKNCRRTGEKEQPERKRREKIGTEAVQKAAVRLLFLQQQTLAGAA